MIEAERERLVITRRRSRCCPSRSRRPPPLPPQQSPEHRRSRTSSSRGFRGRSAWCSAGSASRSRRRWWCRNTRSRSPTALASGRRNDASDRRLLSPTRTCDPAEAKAKKGMVQASRPDATSAQCCAPSTSTSACLQRLMRRRTVPAIGPAARLEQLVCAFDDDRGGALDDRIDAALRQLAVAPGVSDARRRACAACRAALEPGLRGPGAHRLSLSRRARRWQARPIRTMMQS